MLKKVLLIIFLLGAGAINAEEPLTQKAYNEYKEGEQAKTPEARKKAFNDALTHYLQLEPSYPSGELCLNIANTYFQLGEYGFAILYYYKAQSLMPRDSQVEANLQIALQKAGVTVQSPSFVESYLLFFHRQMSYNEKAVTSLVLFFIAFAVISVHIWLPQEFLKKLAILCASIGGIFFISLVWTEYFSPPQVVIVRPTQLHRDAGEQYAVVLSNTCLPGTKLEVLGVAQEGNWVKVELPSGEVGYIAKEYIRPI